MRTIGVVAKPGKAEARDLALKLHQHAPHLEFLVEPHLGESLKWPSVSSEVIGQNAHCLVVLGGDGTLIHAARILGGRSVPIVGVNLGSLGFMTEVPANEALQAFDRTIAGQAIIDSRMKLTCTLYRNGARVLTDEVLNDVVVNKSAVARIVDLETSLNGAYVATFKADGVIFATPTGSTAYSLSAGGPIVHPSIDCVVVTPICPHALTQRPIVVPGDQSISVTLTSDVTDVYLTIDGQTGHPLQKGDRIEVRKSANRVQIVRNPSLDYFAILRQKLRWGER